MKKHIFLYIKKGAIHSWNIDASINDAKIQLEFENFTMTTPIYKVGLRYMDEGQLFNLIMPRENIPGRTIIVRPDMVVMRNFNYKEPEPEKPKRELDEFIGESQAEEDRRNNYSLIFDHATGFTSPRNTYHANEITWNETALTGRYSVGQWRFA